MRPARIYIRRSSDDQSGYSPQAQERETREYCAVHEYQVVALYVDDDVSGTKRSRPALDKLIKESNPGDVIVIHHFDRLGRDTAFILDLVYKTLEPKGVKVESVSGGIDPYTAIGKFSLTMQGGISSYFIDNLKREITKGQREKVQQGGWIGLLPHGYSSEWQQDSRGNAIKGTGKAVPNEDAPIVKEIFSKYATGNESNASLAIDLNSRGITARGRDSRVLWTADRIGDLLQNKFYIGIVTYRGQEYQGNHDPIIEQDVWDCVEAIRARRNIGGGSTPGQRQLGLLSELGRCELCNGPLHWMEQGEGTSRRRYYVCRNRRKTGSCDMRSIQATVLDTATLDWLRTLSIPEYIVPIVIEAVQTELQHDGPIVDRKAIEEKLRRIDKLYQAGAKSDLEWESERAELQRQLNVQPTSTRRLLDVTKALELLQDMPRLLEASSTTGQRELLGALVRSCWYASGRLIAVQPAPAFGVLVQAMRAVSGVAEATSVTSTGLEPVTSSSGGWRSIH